MPGWCWKWKPWIEHDCKGSFRSETSNKSEISSHMQGIKVRGSGFNSHWGKHFASGYFWFSRGSVEFYGMHLHLEKTWIGRIIMQLIMQLIIYCSRLHCAVELLKDRSTNITKSQNLKELLYNSHNIMREVKQSYILTSKVLCTRSLHIRVREYLSEDKVKYLYYEAVKCFYVNM